MALRGELQSSDLAAVFQMVALNQTWGTLVVREKASLTNRRSLYIEENRIRLNDEPPSLPVAALLVEMGKIPLEQYRKLRHRMARFLGDQREALLSQGAVTRQDLKQVQRKIEEEQIMEMFLWKNVTFDLEEGAKPSREAAPEFVVDHLIMESARRGDEWSQHRNERALKRDVYARTDTAVEDAQISALSAVVLDEVDGCSTRARLVERTGLPLYHVQTALNQLLKVGGVRPLSFEELLSEGDTSRERGRLNDAEALYRTALSHRRLDLSLHERLGETLLDLDSLSKGCAHLRFCAARAEEGGNPSRALGYALRVHRRIPTDFRLIPRMLHWMSVTPDDIRQEDRDVVIRDGRRYLDLLIARDDYDDALVLSQELVRQSDDDDLAVKHGKILSLQGRRREGIKVLMDRVKKHEDEQNHSGARAILRALQDLHPGGRHRYQTRILQITRNQERQREGNQYRAKRTLYVLCFVAVLVAYCGYAGIAHFVYKDLSSVEDTNPKALQAAVARLEQFQSSYPWTPASIAAQDLTEDLKQAKSTVAPPPHEGEHSRAELEELALQGEAALNRGMDILLANPEMALEHFREAISYYGKSDRFRSKLTYVQRLEGEAKESLESGRELLNAYTRARKNGDLGEAYAIGFQVSQRHRGWNEIAGLTLPVLIQAFPDTASIEVDGKRSTGTLELELQPDAPLDIMVHHAGHQSATIRATLNPRSRVIPVVLRRTGQPHVIRGRQIKSMHRMSRNRFLVSNGADLMVLEGSSVAARASYNLNQVGELSGEIGVTEDTILLLGSSGLIVGLDAASLNQRFRVWHPTLSADEQIGSPFAAANCVVLQTRSSSGTTRIHGLDRNTGQLLWSERIRHTPTAALACDDKILFLLPGGVLRIWSAVTGRAAGRIDGAFSGELAREPGGRVLAFKNGTGLVRIDVARGSLETIQEFEGRCEHGPRPIDNGYILDLRREGLTICRQSGTVERIPLPKRATQLMDVDGRQALIKLRGGEILLVNTATTNPECYIGELQHRRLDAYLTSTHVVLPEESGSVIYMGR